ncbi:MAG: 1-(5-phosphoribosyl)-5-amino-4-imidazole-carboxyl ate carboxylase [Chloroflexota bacterium]|nr:MAG: 1-(5-phosphoribosyl)-5-amino-4-imidazole-carboxyl ate carboxylase [Chloroflexota bacterium]
MDIDKLKGLLAEVQSGQVGVEQALERLRGLPYDDIGHARLDLHRSLRQGLPEVVFCQNKTVEQVLAILNKLWQHHDRVLATRVSPEMAAAIQSTLPEARYQPASRLLALTRAELPPPAADAPYVMVVTGGTSDLPVAEEAAQTAEFLGSRVERAYDVGVAGMHRLLDQRERLFNADVVISVAGMEGALTSVVGGLVSCPVIGVPTSVGYGAHFGGLAPLLAMLNSCATGVAVVNIDNGFGAGVYAHLILRRIHRSPS